MGQDETKEMTREELAQLLHELADQVGRGEMQVAGQKQAMPARVEVDLEYKEKKGRLQVRVGWRGVRSEDIPVAEAAPAAAFKNVKKRLAAGFGRLRATVQAGNLPPGAEIAPFLEDARAFARLADPEWEPEMENFLSHVENLVLAMEGGNLEMVRHELEDLRNQEITCHREHK